MLVTTAHLMPKIICTPIRTDARTVNIGLIKQQVDARALRHVDLALAERDEPCP